jgi:TPR repeat protein
MFPGDVAVVEVRTQRLTPDRVPEPPLPDSTARVFGGAGWIVGVMAVVATGTVGYLWRPAPQAAPPSQQLALTSNRPNLAPELSVSAANRNASSLDSSKPTAAPPAAGRLAPGASNEQDPRAPIPAQAVPLQPTVSAAAVASMMKNGAELMANGDIAAARMMFMRAAETRDAGAAFALAETYDPLVLRKLGTRVALMSDTALAQTWYEKARDLGSTLAPERIVRLTQVAE